MKTNKLRALTQRGRKLLAKRTGETIPVTMRALTQRINRKLQGEVLKTARSWRVASSVGHYYTIDPKQNWIVRKHVDPEAIARELGVLAHHEHVVE
jgi:hypothetical protein